MALWVGSIWPLSVAGGEPLLNGKVIQVVVVLVFKLKATGVFVVP